VTTTTTRALRTPRSDRSNGQWAVDGRTPLNANEELKLAGGGLEVRERIENVYAREGFASIPHDDLHGRFRWWGLYTQRRPGIEGGRTATLEPHELSDEYFMLRVRLDGGALDLEQLRVLAGISRDFARGTADISDRQNIHSRRSASRPPRPAATHRAWCSAALWPASPPTRSWTRPRSSTRS